MSASFFRLLQVVCVRWGFALGASDDYPFRAMRGALASANFPALARRSKPSDHALPRGRGVFCVWGFGHILPHSRPDVGSEDPLNLSISLSVGTETK